MLALLLAALVAQAGLSEDRARQILPRADLHDLSDAQRAQFLEIAGDTFDYAGCNDTLARCLAANVSDKHALRMTVLIKALLLEGGNPSSIVDQVERYYAGFAANKRHKFNESECGTLGDAKAKVTVVEFSDYQCPHCAHAVEPLHSLVKSLPGKVRLCSKYFPLPGHPRAQVAAGAAEFARQKGKFWEMNGLLFEHQEELGDAELKGFAKQLGLDGDTMLRQVYAGKFDAVIERQKREGLSAGVNATPTLFFNGRQYTLPIKLEFLVFSAQDEDEWQRNGGGWDKS